MADANGQAPSNDISNSLTPYTCTLSEVQEMRVLQERHVKETDGITTLLLRNNYNKVIQRFKEEFDLRVTCKNCKIQQARGDVPALTSDIRHYFKKETVAKKDIRKHYGTQERLYSSAAEILYESLHQEFLRTERIWILESTGTKCLNFVSDVEPALYEAHGKLEWLNAVY